MGRIAFDRVAEQIHTLAGGAGLHNVQVVMATHFVVISNNLFRFSPTTNIVKMMLIDDQVKHNKGKHSVEISKD